MIHGHRDERRPTEREWTDERVQDELRDPPAARRAPIENIGKHPPHGAYCLRVAVAGNRPAHPDVEAPHVIEPEHVVSVSMGQQDGVDVRELARERLRSQSGDASTSTSVPSGNSM